MTTTRKPPIDPEIFQIVQTLTGVPNPRVKLEGEILTYRGVLTECNRYLFDFELCRPEEGWRQYDTTQDAWYFGIWVNVDKRLVASYAEGDMTVNVCQAEDALKGLLERMAEFYGDPPPAFSVIDTETGTVTDLYDERPSVESR